MLSRKQLLIGCLIAFAALASCTKRETLAIAGVDGALNDELIEQFKQEYLENTGVHLNVTYHGCDEYDLLDDAKQGRLYDLMITTNATTPHFLRLNALQPLDHRRIRPLDDYLPYMLNFPTDIGNIYTVPYSYIIMGLVYDTTRIPEAEAASIEVIWNPRYAGHIVMQSLDMVLYGTSAVYVQRRKLAALSNGFSDYTQAFRDSLQAWVTKCDVITRSAVKRALVEQYALVSRYATGTKLGLYMANPDEWVGWMRHPQAIVALEKNHALKFRIPREGAAYCPYLFSMTTACQNVNVAYAFLNFMSRTDVAICNMREHAIPGVITEAVERCKPLIVGDSLRYEGTSAAWRARFFDMFNMPADVAKRTPLLLPPPIEDLLLFRTTIDEFWAEVEKMENGK